jgi:hypothetical protein
MAGCRRGSRALLAITDSPRNVPMIELHFAETSNVCKLLSQERAYSPKACSQPLLLPDAIANQEPAFGFS